MKTNGNRKVLALVAGALAIACAQAAGWDPATRTYDTTGYWNLWKSGWQGPSFSNPSYWKDSTGATASAFDAEACLYATDFAYAKPDQDNVTRFPCKVLAIAETGSLGCTGNSYFDFGSQVDLLAGAWLALYGATFKANGTFNCYSTAEKPNAIKILADTTNESQGYFLKDVTLTGDERAFVVLGGAKAGCTFANFTWESGDGTAFLGTLRVANFPDAPASCTNQLKLADVVVGGTVSLSNSTRLVLCGTSGATVSNLVMDAGSVLAGTTTERRLTVNGKVTADEGLRIDISGLPATGNDEAASWPILKFAPTADLTGFACEDVVFVSGSANTLNAEYCLKELRADEEGGGKTLWLVKPRVVTRTDVSGNEYRTANADNDGYRSEFQFAQSSTTKKDFWSDGSYPNGDAAADIVYAANARVMCFPTNNAAEILTFPGALLSLRSCSLQTSSPTAGWLVPQMRFADVCGIRLCDAAGYLDPAFTDEEGRRYRTMRLQGALDLGDSSDVTDYVEIYGQRLFLRVESALSGKANLRLQTYPSNQPTFLNAALELAGDNSRWTGKLLVKGLNTDAYKDYQVDGQTVAYPNRRNDGHCRLYLANAAGLGGRRAEFAYDALALKHYGEVFLRNDVTLPEGLNRGVSFGDHSTLTVTNGLTFAILQPATWAGTVYKAGAGKLAFGCAPKFGGAEQADTPTEGQNVLVVEGGSVEPLTAEALNGVALQFSDMSCRIALDADSVGAAKGLVNVKAATPFATSASDGKIRFEVRTDKSAETVADGVEVALCTVSATAAEALRGKIDAGRLCAHRGEVLEQANAADGTVTFRALYRRRGSCLIIR